MSEPSDAARVLRLLDEQPPTLGSGRLLCIDGPSGSGKTTLAEAVKVLTDATVVHMDDLYEGWDGLPGVGAQLDRLLVPLASDHPGSYRRWDWHTDAWAETVTVPPAPLLVVEGVGSWSRRHAPLVSALVWLDAPPAVRRERALRREGARLQTDLERWFVVEDEYLEREGTRHHADLALP